MNNTNYYDSIFFTQTTKENRNIIKKRQKAYLKGDKLFSHGMNTYTKQPIMFYTLENINGVEHPKHSSKTYKDRRHNNRKMTLSRLRTQSGRKW